MSIDQFAGARMATAHLADLGHRRILHLAGPAGSLDAAERERGWRAELTQRGLPAIDPLVGDWLAGSGYRCGLQLAAAGGFSAIFSANDQMALGLLHAFTEAGISVPREVSIVGFDDIPESEHFTPPLTTVRQDFGELGRRIMVSPRGGARRPKGRAIRHAPGPNSSCVNPRRRRADLTTHSGKGQHKGTQCERSHCCSLRTNNAPSRHRTDSVRPKRPDSMDTRIRAVHA